MTSIKLLLIGGKTLKEWDEDWVKLSGGLRQPHPRLRHEVGLFRITLGGQIMVVGTGTDKSGGMAKRLSDFRRPSPSGRNHYAGELIYENRNLVEVEVLLMTGNGPDAREIAKKLKTPMIRRQEPAWTVFNAAFMRKS